MSHAACPVGASREPIPHAAGILGLDRGVRLPNGDQTEGKTDDRSSYRKTMQTGVLALMIWPVALSAPEP